MILLSELSRRRIRSINKLVRVNRTEIVMVIRVDKEKGVLIIVWMLQQNVLHFCVITYFMDIPFDLQTNIHTYRLVILLFYRFVHTQVISICQSAVWTLKTW